MNLDSIRHAADVVQWLNLAAVLAILAVALEAGRRWRGWRPYLAGPISWAAHSVAFYLVVLLRGRRVARGDGDAGFEERDGRGVRRGRRDVPDGDGRSVGGAGHLQGHGHRVD